MRPSLAGFERPLTIIGHDGAEADLNYLSGFQPAVSEASVPLLNAPVHFPDVSPKFGAIN
jgi:hypothetical protein